MRGGTTHVAKQSYETSCKCALLIISSPVISSPLAGSLNVYDAGSEEEGGEVGKARAGERLERAWWRGGGGGAGHGGAGGGGGGRWGSWWWRACVRAFKHTPVVAERDSDLQANMCTAGGGAGEVRWRPGFTRAEGVREEGSPGAHCCGLCASIDGPTGEVWPQLRVCSGVGWDAGNEASS